MNSVKGTLKEYKGLGVFCPAYKVMLENDPHHPESVDMVLMKNMILLCEETKEFLYKEYTPLEVLYERGSRPKLEEYVESAIVATPQSSADKIKSICKFVSELQWKVAREIHLGGTEEQIIERGSEWCTELARVACMLYQIAGFPARIVYLADVERAYSGHAIVEIYWKSLCAWCAVDQSSNVVYLYPNGKPASVWDLMHNPKLIHRYSDESLPYVTPSQFRKAAISNYFVWEWEKYSYQITKINEYYRSILEMSEKGWPGGLRWLHGEDQVR
ncbi:MAG: hypothetical protein H0Z28_13085 [Archaeoglobus sp.]|nr:hypothetical protein [Archaeoglobus sp.]